VEEKFPTVRLRYAYDKALDFHIVEISPSEIHEDNEFAELERTFRKEFRKNFPFEDILITSPKSINDTSNIIYETPLKKGMSCELQK
jgi:hypothetical protein